MEVDYWMQYYDVITNTTWRTAANMEIVTSEIDPIMTKFGTLNQIVTLIERI